MINDKGLTVFINHLRGVFGIVLPVTKPLFEGRRVNLALFTEADIIAIPSEESDIIRSRLDLARLKGYIFLIALATIDDDTVIAVLYGSSSKLIAAYQLGDNHLPGHGENAQT